MAFIKGVWGLALRHFPFFKLRDVRNLAINVHKESYLFWFLNMNIRFG